MSVAFKTEGMFGDFETKEWESFVEDLDFKSPPAFTLLSLSGLPCHVLPSRLLQVERGEDERVSLVVFVGSIMIDITEPRLFIYSSEALDANALDRIISRLASRLSGVRRITQPIVFSGWRLGTPYGV